MDIEEFYDADDRRRQSTEVELGTEWHDAAGVRYELNWVQDTGEVYVMREPVPHEWEDPFGGIHVNVGPGAPVDAMTVQVVAQVATRELLEEIFSGWQEVMARPDSVGWVVERIGAAGVAVPPGDEGTEEALR